MEAMDVIGRDEMRRAADEIMAKGDFLRASHKLQNLKEEVEQDWVTHSLMPPGNWSMTRRESMQTWMLGRYSDFFDSSIETHLEILWSPSSGLAIAEKTARDGRIHFSMIKQAGVIKTKLNPRESFLDLVLIESMLNEISDGEWGRWS